MTDSRFTSPVAIGEIVTGVSRGELYDTLWSGVFRGVRDSEWDPGTRIYFFENGLMGTTPQGCFAIPITCFDPQEIPGKVCTLCGVWLSDGEITAQIPDHDEVCSHCTE